jgi:hypothetical protein
MTCRLNQGVSKEPSYVRRKVAFRSGRQPLDVAREEAIRCGARRKALNEMEEAGGRKEVKETDGG